MEEILMGEREYYEIEYRCANCGKIFTKQLRKGTEARGQAGECPNCGVNSGKPGVGHHEMTWPAMPISGGKEILHG
jgi:DNA-directed RNA polymerase subunit RPC12/RpoP